MPLAKRIVHTFKINGHLHFSVLTGGERTINETAINSWNVHSPTQHALLDWDEKQCFLSFKYFKLNIIV